MCVSGATLSMNSDDGNKASFNEVDLIDAKVGGQLNMLGASFNGPLNADLLRVGGNLFAPSTGQYKTKFKSVFLRGADIAGNVSLDRQQFRRRAFRRPLAGRRLSVHGFRRPEQSRL